MNKILETYKNKARALPNMPLAKEMNQNYLDINWNHCYAVTFELQQKIAVAWKANEYKKALDLCNTLVSTFEARAIAVRNVCGNKGSKTAGVDGITWNTAEMKYAAIQDLKNLSNYKASPVRRVLIPKSGSTELRPLGIPTMKDRAMQALFALALMPIAECQADHTSFGYRPGRSAHDAHTYLWLALGQQTRGKWVLDADIKGFFPNISHEWIMKNIPMNKRILEQFLKAGVLHLGDYQDTETGVPQGGVISPIIANMVLDGLTKVAKESVQSIKDKAGKRRFRRFQPKINVVRYADDFVVTCRSRTMLEKLVKPAIKEFLEERGLEFSQEKTRIVHIDEGFDFLGFNFKKYPNEGNTLLAIPRDKSVKTFKRKLRMIVLQKGLHLTAVELIILLNPVLRGWANYYRTGVSAKVFDQVGQYLWTLLWIWVCKKHPQLSMKERRGKYFRTIKERKWIFFAKTVKGIYTLFRLEDVPIQRHSMVRDRNPFLPENEEYYRSKLLETAKTLAKNDPKRKTLLSKTKGLCLVCQTPIQDPAATDVHHIHPRKLGGGDEQKNLILLHPECHRQVTNTKNTQLRARFKREGIVSEGTYPEL